MKPFIGLTPLYDDDKKATGYFLAIWKKLNMSEESR